MRCNQCEEVMINGVRCHETGCPNATSNPNNCSTCDFKAHLNIALRHIGLSLIPNPGDLTEIGAIMARIKVFTATDEMDLPQAHD